MDFCTYNIRGLNNKKAFVKDFLSLNKLSLFALLETHVKEDASLAIAKSLSPRLSWQFNYEAHYNGRIWVGWDPTFWTLNFLSSSSQHITCKACCIATKVEFFISFIYGLNTYMERRDLWSDLINLQHQLDDLIRWCLLGDYNICLGPQETSNLHH